MIHKAIIPAAGYGIRNLPITKAIPKEMFPIAGRPTIDYIVEEAILAGISEILIVCSRHKTAIMDYFDRSIEIEWFLASRGKEHLIPSIKPPKVRIHYIRQHEALGLGHAVLQAKSFAEGDPAAVLLPDQVSLSRKSMLLPLIRSYRTHATHIIGLQRVPAHMLQQYGVVSVEPLQQREYAIHSIIEKPKTNPPSNLAIMGRYLLLPEIFDSLKETKPGLGGEIQLTDALTQLCSNPASDGALGYASPASDFVPASASDDPTPAESLYGPAIEQSAASESEPAIAYEDSASQPQYSPVLNIRHSPASSNGKPSRLIGYEYSGRWYDTSVESDYLKIQQKAFQMKKNRS
ncbi:UTP--glucose-1-phosphate uridylyltransferase [Paenibacillus soyae]|uniref:UTP--glucose-1-phosphate uridylyltransferase n=1 Tax=Paenibacillus soyae TaxID=2969249 RepID=A0A9X2MV55_9BACL|nr:UTP--glucose-1-phosphate uridylyltransferase [Paenibacillus soyae]MCR2806446.1 UTP--glucose-1-phosphate uridylyltransferase [Paenibacillus soyae]